MFVDLDKNSTTWPQREGHVCVQSPSEEDHCNEIHELKNYLSDQKKWLGVPSHEKVNELHKSTLKNERLINSITQMEERLKVSQNLNKNDLHVGKVLASSGFRISKKGNHCLDWALIEIDNERIGENQVSHRAYACLVDERVPWSIRTQSNTVSFRMLKIIQSSNIYCIGCGKAMSIGI